MSTYDGKAAIVTSAGDSFAECHLVARSDGDGWTGTLTEILWRTQMVPQPLLEQERVCLLDAAARPVAVVTVVSQAEGTAEVTSAEPLPG